MLPATPLGLHFAISLLTRFEQAPRIFLGSRSQSCPRVPGAGSSGASSDIQELRRGGERASRTRKGVDFSTAHSEQGTEPNLSPGLDLASAPRLEPPRFLPRGAGVPELRP